MDYNEKYEQALSRAKSAIKECGNNQGRIKMIKSIFPELKENEDEKMLREIKRYIKEQGNKPTGLPNGTAAVADMLAWLEKQGKQETLCDKCRKEHPSHFCQDITALGRCAVEHEQKSDVKIEPKFKVGDWIVYKDTVWKVCNISLLNYYELLKINNEVSTRRIDDVDKNARLWIIQDAKAGDVLADGNLPFIFKKTDTNKYSYAYCGISVDDGFKIESDGESGEWTWMQDIKPATKEQRDLLFQKMKEAGYEWDSEKKELKKIEQKTALSEEDEKILDDTIELIEKANHPNIMHSNGKPLDFTANINFLKSLKDRVQPKVEWSEEDEKMLDTVIEDIVKLAGPYVCYRTDVEWLKSLKGRVQPKQEWSQSDIDMIDWLIRCCEKEHEELCNDKYGHQDIVSDLKRDCRKKWDWLESLKNRAAPQKQWKPSEEQMDALKQAKTDACGKPYFNALASLYVNLKGYR